MGETGGIALIPEDDIEIKSYHEGYMEGMFDNSNVLITLHQFYGDKETIIRNILSGNSFKKEESCLSLKGICFLSDEETSNDLKNVYFISEPPKECFTSIRKHILMSKKEKKHVLTEKVMTVAQKIASFFFNRAEDNVVAPHLSISSHRVLVDKNWNFYLFPYASQMDWTSNKTSVLYYRSDTYLKTLVKKCYNVNPDSLFEEDLYSFYIFLRECISSCLMDSPGHNIDLKREIHAENIEEIDKIKNEFDIQKAGESHHVSKLIKNCKFVSAEYCAMTWKSVLFDITSSLTRYVVKCHTSATLWSKYFPLTIKANPLEIADKIFEFYNIPFTRDSKDHQCLVAVFCNILNIPEEGNTEITITGYRTVLEYMGPLSTNFIDTITQTLRSRWFHGMLSKSELEAKLNGKPKGTFLLRFSASCIGSYAVSTMTRDGIKSMLISHEMYTGFSFGSREYDSLDAIVFNKKKDFGLITPCENNPFEKIFKPPALSRYSSFFDD